LPSKIRPPAVIGGQFRSMSDFTKVDDRDIAEQAAVGNNPKATSTPTAASKGSEP
jgi:hypothetical protein